MALAPVQTHTAGPASRVVAGVTQDDLAYVTERLRPDDDRELEATRFDGCRLADSIYVAQGAAYTGYDRDGNPAVVGGLTTVSPGVAQAWMFGTPRLPEVAVAMHRQARILIEAALNGPAHRIQAYSADFHVDAHRWLKRLGFEIESVMRQHGKGGEDFYMFVRLRPDLTGG